MIRRLTINDTDAFRALRLKSLKECPEAFTSSYEHEAEQLTGWFKKTLSDQLVYGYFEQDVLLAMAGINIRVERPKIAHMGYLWGVYVASSVRGKGVSRALMTELLAHASQHVEMVQLGVGATNHSAKQLYQSFGFTAYGYAERVLKIAGRYIDEILMVKFFR